jgi:hypothetical protein
MGFTRRPPKKDPFRDLLIKLDPVELDRVLQRWVVTDLGLPDETETLVGISIDGKCLCATLRPYAKAVHLLAAIDHQTGYVLSQTCVDAKTNEHKGHSTCSRIWSSKTASSWVMRCSAREKFANKFSIRRATT